MFAKGRSPLAGTICLAYVLALAGCAASPQIRSRAEYSGPIIDLHTHLRLGDQDGASPEQPVGTEQLRALEAQIFASHAGVIVIAPKGDLAETRVRNDGVLAAARASNGFFFPIASVHPDDGAAALEELDRVAKLGVRMIKLHPNTQAFDVASPEVANVVQHTADLGMVVLFDGFSPFDANETGKFLKLAVTHPNARLVLAHLGGIRFHEMAMFGIARKFAWYPRNVWFDISATAPFFADSPYREQLVWVIRSVGTDRVLFGSDWPVDEPARAAAAVRALGLSDAEQRQIFYSNARALLAL